MANYSNYNSPFMMGNNYGYNPQNHFGYNQFAPQNMATQTPPTTTNKIYVSGLDEVKTRLLPPNSDVIFYDNERDILYEKVVDSTGKFQLKTYDIVEHKDRENSDKPHGDKILEYATKSDLEPFNAVKTQYERRMNEQDDTIKALRGELKSMSEKVEALTKIQAKMIEKGSD